MFIVNFDILLALLRILTRVDCLIFQGMKKAEKNRAEDLPKNTSISISDIDKLDALINKTIQKHFF